MLVGQTDNAARSLALSASQRKSFPAVLRWQRDEETRKREPGNSRARVKRKIRQKKVKKHENICERDRQLVVASAAEEKAGPDGRWR